MLSKFSAVLRTKIKIIKLFILFFQGERTAVLLQCWSIMRATARYLLKMTIEKIKKYIKSVNRQKTIINCYFVC